jgi:hypothetical protein
MAVKENFSLHRKLFPALDETAWLPLEKNSVDKLDNSLKLHCIHLYMKIFLRPFLLRHNECTWLLVNRLRQCVPSMMHLFSKVPILMLWFQSP